MSAQSVVAVGPSMEDRLRQLFGMENMRQKEDPDEARQRKARAKAARKKRERELRRARKALRRVTNAGESRREKDTRDAAYEMQQICDDGAMQSRRLLEMRLECEERVRLALLRHADELEGHKFVADQLSKIPDLFAFLDSPV